MIRRTLLVAASLAALSTAASAEAPFNFDAAPGGLPKTVKPSAYKIDIVTDLDKLTLTGRETIEVEVRQPTRTITLNQAGLKLESVKLESGATAEVSQDDKKQTATLTFAAPIPAGKHTLAITYSGPIPESPNGIYYDDYRDASGATKRMLVTQFEVADARRMFPGWDEPAFKATFQLNVTLAKDLATVSNMPIASIKAAGPGLKPGLKTVSFKTSPKMSSYLLALVAGDMKAVSGQAAGVKMSAWAPTGRESQARYSLVVEEKVLPYYNAYFGTAFPLPKLDLLAIPGNYEAGAMENWGAITFIDNAMLFDPANSSPETRQEIFLVVAHEMAHQWNGDLVTMGWWDNIWLNEGFATWMENKATDHFNPEWQIRAREHGDREQAMGQDALPTTHAIQQVIRDESEANSAFDGISYQKGGQVLRMIEDWIGPDVFRAGMRRYMKAHAYSNATSADLWAALGAASGRDVAGVAAGFTEQPGIPLVKVTRSCEGGKASITLTQDRFTIHDPHPRAETWTIPVTVGGPGMAAQHILLTGQPKTLPIAGCAAAVKVNYGENGYYRTQYDAASLAALAKALPTLSPADRADVLGDQYALFRAERAPLGDYMSLLPSLKGERHIAVWEETLGRLGSIDRTLTGSPERAAFDAYAVELIKPAFAELGWDAKPGEAFLKSQLRPEFISALGRFGDTATIAEAKRRFQAFAAGKATLSPALRGAVLSIVGRGMDRTTWEQLRALGVKATSTEEKLRYFSAMAAAADPALMEANIQFAYSGEIPNGRIMQFVGAMSQNSGKADQVFELAVAHEADFAKRIVGDGLGATAPEEGASGSSNPATADKLLALPSSNANNGAHVTAVRIADGIRSAAELKARMVPAVHDWLAGRGK